MSRASATPGHCLNRKSGRGGDTVRTACGDRDDVREENRLRSEDQRKVVLVP
jgi:hypothetical protein